MLERRSRYSLHSENPGVEANRFVHVDRVNAHVVEPSRAHRCGDANRLRAWPPLGAALRSRWSRLRARCAVSQPLRDDGDRLDLDLRSWNRQPAYLDERARRAGLSEELAADGV